MASGQDAVNMAMLAGGMYGPNPYTHFPGGVPQPNYVGVPTDAQGNPIGPPPPTPGVTLNSTPVTASAPSTPFAGVVDKQGMNAPATTQRGGLDVQAWGNLTPAQRAAAYGPLGSYQAGNAMMPSGGPVASHNNPSGSDPTAQTALALMNSGISGFGQMQGAAQPPATPAGPPAGQMSLDDALSRLANPGHVTTPGAQPGATGGGSDILSQFLASQGPKTGAGGYSNQGFFDTLNALKSGSSPQPPAPAERSPQLALAMPPPQIGGLGGLGGISPAIRNM